MRGTANTSQELEAPLSIDYKKLLLIVIVAVGVALLLIRLAGEREALALLGTTKTEFVVLAILAESLRYLAVALYTQKLLHFLGHHIPLWPFLELMFAGGSANRIVSAGGAAGIYVRYRFFDRHSLSLGSLAIVLTMQNVMTGAILLSTFVVGLAYMVARELLSMTEILVGVAILCLVLTLVATFLACYRRPRQLKRLLARLARLIDAPMERLAKRSFYNAREVVRTVDNLYAAVEMARHNPVETVKALCYGVMTLFSDILALYFVFHALGFPIKLGILIVGYIVTNYVVSLLLMPEGIGVTELSLSAVYGSLGVPASTVVVTTLLFRFVAFWLPIAAGLLAMWDLRRKSLL